jgi:hypothetical protein
MDMELYAKDLIDIEQMCWDEDKLETNFIDTDRGRFC